MQTFEHALPIGAILENRYKIESIPGAARMAHGRIFKKYFCDYLNGLCATRAIHHARQTRVIY